MSKPGRPELGLYGSKNVFAWINTLSLPLFQVSTGAVSHGLNSLLVCDLISSSVKVSAFNPPQHLEQILNNVVFFSSY